MFCETSTDYGRYLQINLSRFSCMVHLSPTSWAPLPDWMDPGSAAPHLGLSLRPPASLARWTVQHGLLTSR